jgi:hypothetical protein
MPSQANQSLHGCDTDDGLPTTGPEIPRRFFVGLNETVEDGQYGEQTKR